jgi:hypothetical protein
LGFEAARDDAPGACGWRKLFVDCAGDTVTVVIDRLSGKTRQAHLFVAVLGASSLSFAHARWGETLPDWVECHLLALETFGGAPALLVPDNAKVAVVKACHFDPQVNRTYTRDGDTLRQRCSSNATTSAARQGESRGGGSHRRELATGSAASPRVSTALLT